MNLPPLPRPTHARQTRPASFACLIALTLALGLGCTPHIAQAAESLPLAANSPAFAQVGPARLTSIAEVKVTVPTKPIDFGLQFRANNRSTGYLTKVSVGSDRAVTGTFHRIAAGKVSGLGATSPLGFIARPGDVIHLQATVAAKKTVRLYLRAWKEGTPRPSKWQLAAKDSSASRIRQPGEVWLRAQTSGSGNDTLSYKTESVAPFSAAKAAAVGLSSRPPAISDDTFSIAVIGDTQTETNWDADTRFGDRTAWLAANKNALNLRYAVHTGDVVNWGWLDPAQYTRARKAMDKLTDAEIPWSVAVGNHDTRSAGWNNIAGSSGYGGGPYSKNPECPIRLSEYQCNYWRLTRQTQEFNASFPVRNLTNLGGTFEPGKIDNTWTSFTANGTKWLVLSLEFAPRKPVVEWARKVIASRSDYNVVLATHSYLNSKGGISTSNAGDGQTARYVYDQIVSKYSNVKIVLSGHVGHFTSRTDKNRGNVTAAYLGNYLDGKNNPVRILTINTGTGELANTVYSEVGPKSATTYSAGSTKISIVK